MSYVLNAVAFLIQCVFWIAVGVFLVRVLLIAVGASFYEPFCRAVYTLTNPVITPLRRVIPSWRRIEIASLLVAWALLLLESVLLRALSGGGWRPLAMLASALVDVLDWLILIEMVVLFVYWIVGFFPAARYDGNFTLLQQLSDPIVRPIRRRLPLLAGLDFSFMVAWIALVLARILIVAPLHDLAAQLP